MFNTNLLEIEDKKNISLIECLANDIWHEHYSSILTTEQIDYMLEKFQSQNAIINQIQEGYRYYLIEFEKAPVGYISMITTEDYIFLSKIYVKSDYRGKGIGRQSIDFIVNDAKSLNVDKIRLTVNKYNKNSLAAYKKFGFEIIDEVVADIGHGFVMDDYVMEKPIK